LVETNTSFTNSIQGRYYGIIRSIIFDTRTLPVGLELVSIDGTQTAVFNIMKAREDIRHVKGHDFLSMNDLRIGERVYLTFLCNNRDDTTFTITHIAIQ